MRREFVLAAGVVLAMSGASPAVAAENVPVENTRAPQAGAVRMVNLASGTCLDQNFAGGIEHSDVIAYTCQEITINQWWHATRQDDGTYVISTDVTRKCLDQNYSDNQKHADILAFACHNANNQRWYITGDEDGGFHIKNVASGECLDQNYAGGVPHQEVIAFTCRGKGSRNQSWRMVGA